MKFTCNNCGFSADIPKQIELCPMCGSNNTGCSEEDSALSLNDLPVPSAPGSAERSAVPPLDDAARARNASLSEEFFNKKPYQEEHEIAELLKELGAEEPKPAAKKFSVPIVLGGIALAAVLALVLYAVIGPSDETGVQPPDSPAPVAETVQDTEEPPASDTEQPVPSPVPEPEKPAPAPAPVPEPEKPAPAPVPAPEPPEPEPAPAPAPAPVKTAPAPAPEPPKPAPAPQPKPEPVKAEPKPKPAPKPAPKPKPAGGGAAFDNFVNEGNKAIGEQRFTDAIHAYKAALKLNPRAGKLYKFLGIAYASMGNAAQACQNYRKYIQQTPAAPDRAQVEELLSSCQ